MVRMIGVLLRVETALALVLARGMVFHLPLRWIRRLFTGAGIADDDAHQSESAQCRARQVAHRVNHIGTRLPWRSTCLVRAVALKILLARRGIPGGIVRFGVRKTAGRLEAHAWVLRAGEPLIGGESAQSYAPLADFGPGGDQRPQ